MVASSQGHVEIVQLLLRAGVNANATDEKGRTALMWARRQGHDEIVSLLQQNGARQ